MPEIGPQHPLTYRMGIVASIFDRIRAGGSGVVVGAASMGKSRLLHFLLRADVRAHYLTNTANTTLFAWVDCNRMAEISEWGLYELILTALAEAVNEDARAPLLKLRHEAIIEHNALLAQRNAEMALKMLCQEEGLRVVLVLDEFDECYQELSPQTLANLRGLRDMNKYLLTYLLFTRDTLDALRNPDDVQGFYELLSRNAIGLTPYGKNDALRVIAQQAARRKSQLRQAPIDYADYVLRLSGGHPGLIVALLDGLTKTQPEENEWQVWAMQLPGVQEECRKLWEGLRTAEQHTLNHLAQEIETGFRERGSLLLKGLIRDQGGGKLTFFSPLFRAYIANQAIFSGPNKLKVDEVARNIYIEGRPPLKLTAKEYELVAYLYEHLGEVRSNEEIITALYPGKEGFGVSESNITALIRRTRKKIELEPAHPQFLHNVRGRGYRLVDESDTENLI